MGARVILSGLQDAVVEALVDLGMLLPNVHAVLDLDDALVLSRENRAEFNTLAEEGAAQEGSRGALNQSAAA